jgi:hypothetical protein
VRQEGIVGDGEVTYIYIYDIINENKKLLLHRVANNFEIWGKKTKKF